MPFTTPTTHTEVVHTTPNYPWLTADHGGLIASFLRVGEPVQRVDGSVATVESGHSVPTRPMAEAGLRAPAHANSEVLIALTSARLLLVHLIWKAWLRAFSDRFLQGNGAVEHRCDPLVLNLGYILAVSPTCPTEVDCHVSRTAYLP